MGCNPKLLDDVTFDKIVLRNPQNLKRYMLGKEGGREGRQDKKRSKDEVQPVAYFSLVLVFALP